MHLDNQQPEGCYTHSHQIAKPVYQKPRWIGVFMDWQTRLDQIHCETDEN